MRASSPRFTSSDLRPVSLTSSLCAVETGSAGGTLGWMSPEELHAVKNNDEAFESRLSGDIHTAGSIMFFILTGGVHPFGDFLQQPSNIARGRPNLRALKESGASATCACDLFLRMVCVDPKQRPEISGVVSHPALWDADTKLRRITDWAKSWEKDSPALQRRLSVHATSVKHLLGDFPEGWLARVDAAVAEQLQAASRYNGWDVMDLLRAIRNIAVRTQAICRCLWSDGLF